MHSSTLAPLRRIRHIAIPIVLFCVMLVGCSTPDGPPPPDEAAKGPAEMSENVITLSGPGQLLPITATAEARGILFQLEVAQTPQQQALGLMFRSELPDDRGMLFPFGTPRRTSFWMKNVPVSLDIVFLRDGKVVFIAAEAPPCSSEPCPTYGPTTELVDQVVELRSGRAAEIGLQVGDAVAIITLEES